MLRSRRPFGSMPVRSMVHPKRIKVILRIFHKNRDLGAENRFRMPCGPNPADGSFFAHSETARKASNKCHVYSIRSQTTSYLHTVILDA